MLQNQRQMRRRPARIALGAVCFALTVLTAQGVGIETDELQQAARNPAAATPVSDEPPRLVGAATSIYSSRGPETSPNEFHRQADSPTPDASSQAQPVDGQPRYAALVFDANSGAVLFEEAAGAPRFPASLTKMMTLYLLFEELQAGRLSLESNLIVSDFAANTPPSKLGLAAGQTLSVEDAILGLAVKSANDVAVVVAENLEGSVAAFARRMTRTAEAIGMESTNFTNAHGLPDTAQVSTARDMALLGLSLHDRFPSFFRVFRTEAHSYGGASFRNTNKLLAVLDGMEGIKTGYTRASGFNLVSSIKRGGRHLIVVVIGGRTAATRDAHVRELIEQYLPAASAGDRVAPLLVADTSHVNSTPLPRARPGHPPVPVASIEQDRTRAGSAGAIGAAEEELSGGAAPSRQTAVIAPGEATANNLAGVVRGPRKSPCSLIEAHAREQDLPVSFLTRLIWKESSFNPNAVSPVGAQGIAQFMPATAAERGLTDPFDPDQAIPHAATFLRELNERFGNLGLAAAAYNAGPGRVQGWLGGRSGLPVETQNYVRFITGRAASDWRESQGDGDVDSGTEWEQDEDCERTLAEAQTNAPIHTSRASAAKPHANGAASGPVSITEPAANAAAGGAQKSVASAESRDQQHEANAQDEAGGAVVTHLKRSGGNNLYSAQAAGSASGDAREACDRQRSSGNHCVVVVKHNASAS